MRISLRGLIQKRQGANYYRVTEKGYVWINLAYSHNRYFLTPLLSDDLAKSNCATNEGHDTFEKAQKHIKTGLQQIYQQLNIVA